MSLDWGFLREKATAGLQAKAGAEIQDELNKVGGNLRDKLGLGGAKTPAAQTPATPAPAPAPAAEGQPAAPAQPSQAAAEPPKSAEDRLKAEADKALNKLFGRN